MSNPPHDNVRHQLPVFSFGTHREQMMVSMRYASPREDLKARLLKANDWEAGIDLGHLYRLGIGGPADPAMATKYYRLAFKRLRFKDHRSDVSVALMRGLTHWHGWGTDKDTNRALPYFRMARILLLRDAQFGDTRAAHDLAALFLHGMGGERDPYQAEYYFRMAADAGYLPAQIELADLLMHSPDPLRNEPEAALYYDKIAHSEGIEFRHLIRSAQYHLGGIYYAGIGRVVDYETAYVWFAIAASSGHEDANKRRRALESLLNTAQVLNAQRRAREWPLGPGSSTPPPANGNNPGGAAAMINPRL